MDFSGSPELDYEIVDGKYVKRKRPAPEEGVSEGEQPAGPGLLDRAYDAVGGFFKPGETTSGERMGNKLEQFRRRGVPPRGK